jgi:type IV pilus assembly protein PilW
MTVRPESGATDLDPLRPNGFGLVELLVAMAVGLFLTAGILQVLLSSQRSFRAEQDFSHLQENARFAVQVFARDTRAARDLGCSSLRMDEVRKTLNTLACSLRQNPAGCAGGTILSSTSPLGYDATFDAGAGQPAQRGAWAALPQNVLGRWVRGDVLALWGTWGQPTPVAVGTPSGVNATQPIQLISANPDLRAGRLALITDCESSDVFAISALGTGGLLQHAAGPNTSAALSRRYNFAGTSQIPGVANRASVYPFDYRVYYICCTDTANGGLAGNPASCRAVSTRFRPSLCVWGANSGMSQQLVNDIADLRITYNGDADGDGMIDFFNADAATVTAAGNWPNVYSAEIELLATSEDTNVSQTGANPSDSRWPGGDDRLGAGLAADGRLYDRFAFTVALRTRAPWYVQR